MTAAARRIAEGLAEADRHGDPAATWYGYVDLADVRQLVDAVLRPESASTELSDHLYCRTASDLERAGFLRILAGMLPCDMTILLQIADRLDADVAAKRQVITMFEEITTRPPAQSPIRDLEHAGKAARHVTLAQILQILSVPYAKPDDDAAGVPPAGAEAHDG